MRAARTLRRLGGLTVVALTVLVVAGPADGLDVYLVAKEFDKAMPDGSTVKMWGFAVDADSNLLTRGTEVPTVPGPRIPMPPGDNTLHIHLRNDLPVVPGALATRNVSIVVPGLVASLSPVKFLDAQSRPRARSFSHETAPCNGPPSSSCIATYTFSNIPPGTRLYHSGTHPAVQVQMGLYGGLIKDAGPRLAYNGNAYDTEAVLFYSEIDPILHAAVAGPSPTYGSAGYPSTLDYKPAWFLVNGDPFTPGQTPQPGGNVNQRLLIRFLNAGLKTHAPMLLGGYLDVVAEDGHVYPFARRQYTVLLPALKTTDAIFVPTRRGFFPLYDRSLHLTNAGAFAGGMQSTLVVGPINPPVAVNDSANGTINTPILINVVANDTDADGDLDPASVTIVAAPTVGTAVINSADAPGTIRYMTSQRGTFTFTYHVKDLLGVTSNVATVTVNALNTAPIARNDVATTRRGVPVLINVTANDIDRDGTLDKTTLAVVRAPSHGTVVVNPPRVQPGRIRYRPAAGFVGIDTFTYTVKDTQQGISNVATVTVTVY